MTAALIVIDVQNGFDDPHWGPRNNPECESNIRLLLKHWRDTHQPVVLVRHDSTTPGSPLEPGHAGNDFKPGIHGTHDLLVSKHTNSAFYGTPNLDAWLTASGIDDVVICGISTDHCCSTTARMAANLGRNVTFVLDATHTFDRQLPDGTVIDADTIFHVNAASLSEEFATIRTTDDVIHSDTF